MGENSAIEWTDHTFNAWVGCEKVHEGCAHCYAEEMMDSRFGFAQWGPVGPRVVTAAANWKNPLRWNAKAEKAGVRERVFCQSVSDVFENWNGRLVQRDGCSMWVCEECGIWRDGALPHVQTVPVHCYDHGPMKRLRLDDARIRLGKTIDATPHLDWLLLTKRPERIREAWPQLTLMTGRWRLPNVWLGTSISKQAHADKQIPDLLKCKDLCAGTFLSIEPMLGPIDLLADPSWFWSSNLKWVIAGGESGPQARPMHPDWVRSIRNQCLAAGVPFFFKQWGEWALPDQVPEDVFVAWDAGHNAAANPDRDKPFRFGTKKAGAMLDGREWRQTPFPLSPCPPVSPSPTP